MKALERQVETLNKDLLKNAAATKASGRAAATASGNVQRFGIAFRSTIAPLVASIGLVTQLSRSLSTLAERESDTLVLARNLQNIGQGTEKLEELQAVADQLDLGTLFNSEDFNKGFALLTSFKAIGVDSYERVSKAAADLATITGTDLKSAQLQLAKALENPVEGMSALSRSGTTFTKTQKDFVKALVESNQALEAQNYILSIVEGQYKGAAKAAAGGYAGALDTLSKRWRDVNEQIGEVIQPAATAFLNGLAGYLELVKDELVETAKALSILSGWIQSSIGKIAAIGEEMRIAAGKAKLWFLQLSDLVGLRSTFEGWGNVLSNEVAEFDRAMIRSIPIIGQYFTAIDALRRLRGGINSTEMPGTDVDNNPLQGADLDMDAIRDQQRWADLMKSVNTPAPVKTGGKSGSGVDKATRELERQRKELERQFEAGENIKRNLENQMMLLRTTSDLEKERLQIAIDLDDAIRQIQQTAAPTQQEGLIITATEEARLKDMIAIAKSGGADLGQSLAESMPEVNDELTQTEELLKGSYEIVANSLTSGIKGLIDGTKEWSDVLSDVLGQLGSMFLNAGFSALGKGLQIPGFFADGGRPPVGEVSVVGEKGPELFVPDRAGTVIPNDESTAAIAAMNRYNRANQPAKGGAAGSGGSGADGDSAGAAHFNYSPQITAMDMGGQKWVTVEQMNETVQAGMSRAASEGAKAGEAQTLRRLRMNPSTRKQVGI
jgi:hypothetical protein